jgi:hypothetical protein
MLGVLQEVFAVNTQLFIRNCQSAGTHNTLWPTGENIALNQCRLQMLLLRHERSTEKRLGERKKNQSEIYCEYNDDP